MAEEELDLNNLGENDTELFDEMKDIMEGEAGDDGHDELEQFLIENKLHEHLPQFRDQQIDYETLMILTETDLKSLGLPLGPFRKLIIAIQQQKKKNGVDDAVKIEGKSKDDSDLPTLTDEGNFRVIDESGDDSDAHSVKSEGGKKKEDSSTVEPDKNHPYKYDVLNFVLADEFKEKIELQDPVAVDTKTCEMVRDEGRLKSAIRTLRKEKIIAVDFKYVETYEKTMTVMQISTQTVDYLIDFSKMNELILMLTDIFTNPNILKVFYDAKHEVKILQKYYNLFTINAYCVRTAVKQLKYETSSLYSLINKYTSYFKLSNTECSQRPLRNDVKTNLRKETHYILHVYYKTRNEAIEAGVFDAIVAVGTRICGYLHVPLKERKPENFFPDYEKFNEAQKLAADELNSWRESVAKDKNVDPITLMTDKDMKQLCMTLPIKKEELLAVVDTRIVRIFFLKLLAILKAARKKYFNDPKDDARYDLKTIDTSKAKGGRPPAKVNNPKPKGGGGGGGGGSTPGPNPKPDLKRKSDGFAHPAAATPKKGRFRQRKNFNASKRNSFDSNKSSNKSPKGSPSFRNSGGGGYRGGFQGNSPVGKNNFQQNVVKYPNPQNIWEPTQNQNFGNNYGPGFKYY